nr:hypothetical protein CFP56_75818 [Quercus suber]
MDRVLVLAPKDIHSSDPTGRPSTLRRDRKVNQCSTSNPRSASQSRLESTLQPDKPQASPYLTREDVAAILLEARKAESSAYIDIRPFHLEEMVGDLTLPTTHLLSFPREAEDLKGLLGYIHRFRDLSLICYDLVKEKRLVDICIASMLYEYHLYIENLQIPSFTRLVEASKRTSMSVRKPSKSLTLQTISAPK